jgi:MFS family permease
MTEKPLPVEKWRLWKLILVSAVFFGIWTSLPTLYPNYSPAALIIGIFLTIVGTAGAVLVGRGRRRLGQIAVANALFLLILTLGARAWLLLVGNVWTWAIWITFLLAAYILAWALPALNPKFSAFLWKEQYTPETRFGQAVLSISARVLPIAAAGGALIGMYGTRSGHNNLIALLIGIGFTMVSIGMSQVTSHQFWREDHMREQHQAEVG